MCSVNVCPLRHYKIQNTKSKVLLVEYSMDLHLFVMTRRSGRSAEACESVGRGKALTAPNCRDSIRDWLLSGMVDLCMKGTLCDTDAHAVCHKNCMQCCTDRLALATQLAG